MGFDAMFFGRMDNMEEAFRLQNKEEEWIQFPMYEKFGTEYQLLHHKLKNSYVYPDGFGFDMFNDDDPFQTDSNLTTYNAVE